MARSSAEKIGLALGTAAGAITVVASFTLSLISDEERRSVADSTQAEIVAALEERWNAQLADLRSEIQDEVTTFTNRVSIPEGAEIGIQFDRLDQRIDKAFERLEIVDTIATAIQENPERAMSIPLLRRDVDALGEEFTQDLASIRNEVDRIYDLGKWFLGLIATMAIGILGLAFGNLGNRKE